MRCAWKELLSILPKWMHKEVANLGADKLQEIRLRCNAPPELVTYEKSIWLSRGASGEDLQFCVNAATRYSPWAAATVSQGYITAPGGHRIGLCGDAVNQNGRFSGIRTYSSLCIRVAKDYPGIGKPLLHETGSILILGAPGWGKTTLLRDLIRLRSDNGEHIAVVDERCELFPDAEHAGKCTDILKGSSKQEGITMLLRAMGPACIAVDEITAAEDVRALIGAAWCGVSLLATAHAASLRDFLSRKAYEPLWKEKLFDLIVVLHPDKTWHTERSIHGL